jgi:hypothetical protein
MISYISWHCPMSLIDVIRTAAYEVIPFVGIVQIERTKYVHLYHIVGMSHGKPSVGSCISILGC